MPRPDRAEGPTAQTDPGGRRAATRRPAGWAARTLQSIGARATGAGSGDVAPGDRTQSVLEVAGATAATAQHAARPARPAPAALPAEAPGPLRALQRAGWDVALGLARMEGDAALYGHVLRAAAPTLRDWSGRFEQALGTGDREVALRLAHDLTSISAPLGGEGLAQHAGRIEATLQAAASALPMTLRSDARFDADVQAIAHELQRWAAAVEAPAAPASPGEAG